MIKLAGAQADLSFRCPHMPEVTFSHGAAFQGCNPVTIVLSPSETGSTLKGKNLLPKFFPFRIDLFSEGDGCAGKQTVSHNS